MSGFVGSGAGQTEDVDLSEQITGKSADDDTALFDLPNNDTAPGQARRAVRTTLTRWRLLTVLDDAVLAVSELVTNALRHGLPPIGLLLRRRPGEVRIEVDDAGTSLLGGIDTPGPFDETGRGLGIVRDVSDHCGSQHIDGDGKRVYASWATAPVPATTGPQATA